MVNSCQVSRKDKAMSDFSEPTQRTSKLRDLQQSIAGSVFPLGATALIGKAELNKKLLSEYMSLCLEDPNVAKVANEEELLETCDLLQMSGAGQWVKGSYVSLQVLSDPQLLDYFLKATRAGKSLIGVVFNLTEYFEKGLSYIPKEWFD
ncbi:MAG: hypothetical protein WCV68_00045 [Candidatus Paceibacterota bacterium]|jgi:hypothetical protein